MGKLITVLEKTLGKLSAHDEGTMMGGFFNKLNKVTNVSGNGTDLGKSYVQFVRTNMDVIGKRVNDDLWVLSAMEVRINLVQLRSWMSGDWALCNDGISEMVFQPSTNAEHLANRETGQITQSISMYLPLLCCKG